MAVYVSLSCLLLIFLSCLSCLVCSQSLRDEDEIIHNVALGSGSGLNRRSVDQAMRISLVYLDISKVPHVSVVKSLLNESTEYFRRTLRVRHTVDKILLDRKCLNGTYFLKNETYDGPGNVRFCKVACDSSKPLCGPGPGVVPDEDLAACRVCTEDGHDCKLAPGYKEGAGHTDTDFVLYVTASNDKCNGPKTVAYAAVCQQEFVLDRPVAGFLNVCPDKMSNMTMAGDHQELLATFKHEIFHALGFSPSLYAFYRDNSGETLSPRTERGNMPTFDNTLKLYKWSDKVIKEVKRHDWMIRPDKGLHGTVEHRVHVMATAKVQHEVRKHFNCSSLEGAELENQGGPGSELAHWEKRLFENEGMTGAFTQNSVFSRITLALMEDTGWYKANYAMAEPLRWGKNQGCLFAKNSCRAWMFNQHSQNKSLEPFCRSLNHSKQDLHVRTGCSTDKSSVATCNLVRYNHALPLEYQYFISLPGIANAESYGGSVNFADFCPYYQGFTWTKKGVELRGSSCSVSGNSKPPDENYALEVCGAKSKCFTQGRAWSKTKCGVRWITRDWGSGCYEYKCEQDGLKVIIQGYKFMCFHAGQVLNIRLQGPDAWLFEGSVVCPPCKDVCYDSPLPCPADISPAPPGAQPKPKIASVFCSKGSSIFLPRIFLPFISCLFLGIMPV